MQFWLRFRLLNAVVWMSLTTHAAKESFCTEGCPSYNIAGIALPVDGIQHNISVWQEKKSQINLAGWRREALGRKWHSITTMPRDGEICIVSPGLLMGTGYCRVPDEFVAIVVYSEKSSWSLDCNGDSCGCHRHRLIAMRIDGDLESKVFWWPPQNISKVVIALYLHSSVEKVTTFQVPNPPKWHDFVIGGRSIGYTYQLMSSSLNVNESRNGQKVWIYGINDNGEKIPSYFALGCDAEPTEYPDEEIVDENGQRRIIIGLSSALGVLLLFFMVAVVLIKRCRPRRRGQKTELALESRHNEVPLGHQPQDLRDRLSKEDHEYSYIDAEVLRIQLERERAEGLGLRNPVQDSVDRRSTDDHEYCYIDTEALRIQLEKEKAEGLGPRNPNRDLVARRSTDDHEYCYIDAEALRIQLEKEKRENSEGQKRRKISTTSHESKNSLYEEMAAVDR